jgi:spoIIIJ-associated protein
MSDTQATEADTRTDRADADESAAVTVSEAAGSDVTDGPVDAAGQTDDVADDAEGDEGDEGDESAKPEKGDKKSRVRQLEREGEVAADFLETLLDIADLDGDIDVDVDGDRAAIAIVDSDEGRVPRRLVGADGKVLEALQELTRLAVQAETGERSRLMLDIAGHRAQRRSALVELAKVAIAEVKETGTKRSLEPMSAFERKVVHDEVAAAGLVSESEGVDPHRHIVILPS